MIRPGSSFSAGPKGLKSDPGTFMKPVHTIQYRSKKKYQLFKSSLKQEIGMGQLPF